MANTAAQPSPRHRILVGHTRGALRGPRGKLKGGPANSRGELDPEANRKISQRCKDHGFRLAGWLEDSGAPSDLEKGPEELLRLQEAVFLVRADLVHGVYVHDRRHIPDLYWPTSGQRPSPPGCSTSVASS
jgi:hypothetical protein